LRLRNRAGDLEERPDGLTEAQAAQRLTRRGENVLIEHHVGVLERIAHFCSSTGTTAW